MKRLYRVFIQEPLKPATHKPYMTPKGSLIQAKDGNLYGMTESGGASNAGTIFQCTTSGTFTKLYDFNGTTDGANAQGSLVQATDGNLYGMTWSGGANSFGTIFKCTTTGTFTKLMDFSSTTGGSLYGSFIQATDSNLYAVTQSGATYGDGGIIKYTLAGQFSRVYDFDGSKGYGPQYSDLLEAMSTSISVGTPGCTNRTITANVQGGGIGTYSYSWSTGASTSSISVPNTAIGYTVTVKGANGVTRSSTISLPAYIPLTATAGVVAEPKCNGDANGSVSVTAFNGTAGYTYLWNNGQTTTTVSGLTAGIYTVIVTDANSCTATVKDTLKDPDLLTANITSSVNPTCHGFSNGSAIITAGGGTGAYSYLWNNVSGTTTSTLNGVGGGTYSVTVTDANNCTAITSVTLTSPAAINITVTDKNPLCSGSNGSASINANGGTPGYIFSWSNGATTSSISNISAGSYSVIITDSHSCTDTVKLTLTTTTPVTITTATVTNVSCPTCADGSAKVTITGGSNNTIEWKDSTATGYVVMANHTSDTISKLTSGTYVCVVTDSCGSKTDTIRLKKSTVGIQTINANDEITVYPVPTSGLVSFTAEGVECKLLTIYDETGKQIYTHVLDARNANSIITVDMSVYANGIYFAQIITSNGVANKKIIIQK